MCSPDEQHEAERCKLKIRSLSAPCCSLRGDAVTQKALRGHGAIDQRIARGVYQYKSHFTSIAGGPGIHPFLFEHVETCRKVDAGVHLGSTTKDTGRWKAKRGGSILLPTVYGHSLFLHTGITSMLLFSSLQVRNPTLRNLKMTCSLLLQPSSSS